MQTEPALPPAGGPQTQAGTAASPLSCADLGDHLGGSCRTCISSSRSALCSLTPEAAECFTLEDEPIWHH